MRRSLRINLIRLAVVLCGVTFQITACTGLFSDVGTAAPRVNIPGPAVDEPVGAPDARELPGPLVGEQDQLNEEQQHIGEPR